MLNVIKHVDQRLAAKNLGVSCLTSILEQSKNENSLSNYVSSNFALTEIEIIT